ncbi:MAG: carbohydrate kinase family protein [Chloroflexota bacterium]
MGAILISGLINLETTLRVERFPLEYFPVTYPFFGIRSSVSGVGYNIARALTVLGNPVRLLSLIGKSDPAAYLARDALQRDGIPAEYVLPSLEQTCQSVIVYDPQGRRQIHTDLKDVQKQAYPQQQFDLALVGCNLAVLCNINFSRPLLVRARQAGIWIATDVHAIADLEDDYNRDFMQAANILFMSHERLPVPAAEWARAALARFPAQIIVIGMGGEGCLLADRQSGIIEHVPAVKERLVVNTIGAGDALFSAFLHGLNGGDNARVAIRKAAVFAAHKIGAVSASDGFLDREGLEARFRWAHPDTPFT